MLNFNKKVTDIITENTRESRRQSFTYYGSKKQLTNANVLSTDVLEYVIKIKGAYGFDLHVSNKYLLIYVYDASNKSYSYYVMDLENLAIAQVTSPRIGKDEICKIIAAEKEAEENTDKTAKNA